MSNVKDKLSASMRTVKAGGKPVAKPAAAKPAAAKPAAAKKTAPRKAARKTPAKAKPAVPGDVPESGTELFPARVWPD
ncbi:MAG: hypothetical protein OEV12_05155 [Gammaproteobacteria bacterium]|nr:hypothetical protein [Gammaproteobacteria bacterium]